MALALAIFAATVLLPLLIIHRGAANAAAALGVAAITAAGTLAVALVMLPYSGVPRRAFLGAAAILAACVLASPLTAASPSAWTAEVRPVLWLMPWLFLGPLATRKAGADACSAAHPRAEGILLGVALLFGVLILSAGAIGDALGAWMHALRGAGGVR
jgi:hypothetical protein